MACPPLEELLQFIRGSLEPSPSAVVEAHFSSGCRHCQENHRWLTEVCLLTKRDDSFEFPEETVQWSVAQFKAMSGMLPSRTQLLARLIFDNLFPRQAV